MLIAIIKTLAVMRRPQVESKFITSFGCKYWEIDGAQCCAIQNGIMITKNNNKIMH